MTDGNTARSRPHMPPIPKLCHDRFRHGTVFAAAIVMSLASVNPATGERMRYFSPLSEAELDRKIQTAWNAFHKYRNLPVAQRSRLMKCAAGILDMERKSF